MNVLAQIIRLWGPTLATAFMLGCPYGPPIVEPPEPIDTPPFWFPEDVYPSGDAVVIVDLRNDEPVTFEIRNVYDFNISDPLRVRWTYSIRQSDSGVFVPEGTNVWIPFFEGDIRPRAEQPYSDITLYEGPSIRFERCFSPISPAYSRLTVRVEVIDEIAMTQRDQLGRDRYIVVATWEIEIRGECEG